VRALGDEDLAGSPSPDARHRGSLAHRLLERVDFSLAGSSKLDAHLEELAESAGLSPRTAEGREVLAWVRAFLRTPFASEVGKLPSAQVHRELPFVMRVAPGEGTGVWVKGQVDLLIVGEHEVTVVDYKSGRRRAHSEGAYAFQLRCYALAARRLTRGEKPVRVGLAFLQDGDPGPDFHGFPTGEELEVWQAELARAAPEAAALSNVSPAPGRDRAFCDGLGCGYRYRCHPRGSAC
jgi:ATP-dependent exoDNAse (exonuclease V) beta subunit